MYLHSPGARPRDAVSSAGSAARDAGAPFVVPVTAGVPPDVALPPGVCRATWGCRSVQWPRCRSITQSCLRSDCGDTYRSAIVAGRQHDCRKYRAGSAHAARTRSTLRRGGDASRTGQPGRYRRGHRAPVLRIRWRHAAPARCRQGWWQPFILPASKATRCALSAASCCCAGLAQASTLWQSVAWHRATPVAC